MEYPEMAALTGDGFSDLSVIFLFHIAPYAENRAQGVVQ
jgi:hypothetical protein